MKRVFMSTFFIFFSCIYAEAIYYSPHIEVVPAAPTSADSIQIHLQSSVGGSASFQNPETIITPEKNITIDQSCTTVLSLPSVTPYDGTVKLGSLADGTYHVTWALTCVDSSIPKTFSQVGNFSFTVASVSGFAISVPTMSEWGTILFVLLLGVLSVHFLGRMNTAIGK